jgi:hypothetical protein
MAGFELSTEDTVAVSPPRSSAIMQRNTLGSIRPAFFQPPMLRVVSRRQERKGFIVAALEPIGLPEKFATRRLIDAEIQRAVFA